MSHQFRQRPIRTYTLDADRIGQLEDLAQKNERFHEILENFHKYGAITEKQFKLLNEEMHAEPKINGVIVINRLLRDNRVVCFYCREYATDTIGNLGVCAAHGH